MAEEHRSLQARLCGLRFVSKKRTVWLGEQMKRAAVSVASNIAEGQARQHLGEFRQFLAMANGSLAELDTQRIIAEELGLINRTRSGELDCAITEIRKMLYSLSSKAQPIAKN